MTEKAAGPAEYHTYTRKVLAAVRRIDTSPTPAQREAGNYAKAHVHLHNTPITLEYGRGQIRSGVGADGKKWQRVVNAAGYGYIKGTEAGDGEQLDLWLGDHPQSVVCYIVQFLKPNGEADEWKAIGGVRNLREARELIDRNYPDGFWSERIGEVRGILFPELKKHLKELGVVKGRRKEAAAGFMCKKCWTYRRYRTEAEGCPECDKED